MRLSINPADHGFGHPACHEAKVYLDGAELKNCVTADEDLGEVLILALGADGRPIQRGDTFVQEWRHGVVKIVLPS